MSLGLMGEDHGLRFMVNMFNNVLPSFQPPSWRLNSQPPLQRAFASATFAMAAGRAALRKEGGEGCGSVGKESAYNEGGLGLIPGLGRSPGEGNGNPLRYSCLENSMTEDHPTLIVTLGASRP